MLRNAQGGSQDMVQAAYDGLTYPARKFFVPQRGSKNNGQSLKKRATIEYV